MMTPAQIVHTEIGLRELLDAAIARGDTDLVARYGYEMATRRGIDLRALVQRTNLKTSEVQPMSFPYQHANGNICCEDPTYPCPACRARLAAEKRHASHTPARAQRVAGATGADGMWHPDPRTLSDDDRPMSEAERMHFLRGLVDAKRKSLATSGTPARAPARPRQLAADEYEPPKPYDEALKKLRESGATPATSKPVAPRPRANDFTPPNPYDIALQRRKEK